ncbi:MAG: toxic anion resistance protein [Eubacterium sp.]|nr:toxic anion resistance protein [Eubacterium sp.]
MAFSLDLPVKEEIKEEVIESTRPPKEEIVAIHGMVEEQAQEILGVDLDSFVARKEITDVIDSFGNDLMQKSEQKNALLKRSMGALQKAGGESGDVAKGLEDISVRMRDLDPSKVDFAKKGILGKAFAPARRYFEKYKSADGEIADIVKSLDKGKTTLINDVTTLEMEQAAMRDLTKQLNEKIETATKLDSYLTAKIGQLRAAGEDADKIKFIEEDVLFPLKQKIMDLQQVLVVNQQGIIAMEIIRKNNKELIRSVDRAKNVTVSALRVAVIVAASLYDQKIVLEKVKMLNETTNQMLASTSSMLKDQGVQIQEQAMDANIDVDTMKKAFADTFEALDSISSYKQKAIPMMNEVIDEFRRMADEGEEYLQRIDRSK